MRDIKDSSVSMLHSDYIQELLWPNLPKTTFMPKSWCLVENNPTLPTRLILSNNNLRASYVGLGNEDSDAACVRTKDPIPVMCGIYYFEMTVLSKGEDGYIGIGLCLAESSFQRLPGWEQKTFGYHGDDGCCFQGSGKGTKYGPCYTTNDTVGCCINFINKTCFYTKNGIHLGVSNSNINTSLSFYPCSGMRTVGEVIEGNFGQTPFLFDIVSYVMEFKRSLLNSILSSPLIAHFEMFGINERKVEEKLNSKEEEVIAITDSDREKAKNMWPSFFNKLIFSYLIHHGYNETALLLMKESNEKDIVIEVNQRIQVQKAILTGQIDKALNKIGTYFPEFIQSNQSLYFTLKVHNDT